LILGAVLSVLAEAGIGMVVNLYVTIPSRHPGEHPSDYSAGSFQSVNWAIAHGAEALSVHATLGIVLVLTVLGVAIDAFRLRARDRGLVRGCRRGSDTRSRSDLVTGFLPLYPAQNLPTGFGIS
jgi:hypothetical protein